MFKFKSRLFFFSFFRKTKHKTKQKKKFSTNICIFHLFSCSCVASDFLLLIFTTYSQIQNTKQQKCNLISSNIFILCKTVVMLCKFNNKNKSNNMHRRNLSVCIIGEASQYLIQQKQREAHVLTRRASDWVIPYTRYRHDVFNSI